MASQPHNSCNLVFTHGGLICSLTYDLGLENIITTGSCIGLIVDQDGNPEDIAFEWSFPIEEIV